MAPLELVEINHKPHSITDKDETVAWVGAPDTVGCPAWCGGKHDEAHPDDRVHWSTDTLVFEPVLAAPEFERIGDKNRETPLRLLVTMEQGFREVGPRISLAPESLVHGRGFAFTACEAEKVAHQILEFVAAARAVDNGQQRTDDESECCERAPERRTT
jgi:hypothetical protein